MQNEGIKKAQGDVEKRWYLLFKRRLLVEMEFKAFGYRPIGNFIDETDHGEKIKVTVDSSGDVHAEKYRDISELKYAQFVRHKVYVTNFWFRFLERLMRIFSFIRVHLPIITIVYCNSIFDAFFRNKLQMSEDEAIVPLCFFILAAIYGPSLIIMLLGYLTRKLCKLDERTDEVCERNGFRKWSEYKDNDPRISDPSYSYSTNLY